MRVKSIVLDGFKSYAHRQELGDLDAHFNAITGFNGSGKSNVFDAICFVMGINNLKKVRADDTRDLIYRAGAAGVQSARVTIEFINDDPQTAPAGYPTSEYPIITIGRQTQIGGKQRYFFMNRLSDQSKIKHFFQNIHLNVDNPHFMVLQGTVHKLIGMKSSDILALVEEAVGTKVFDVRRRTAENLIRGKERRLEEIHRNIREIGPSLEAMKADQLEYDQFLRASEALESNRKFRVAFQFWSAQQEGGKQQATKDAMEQELRAAKETLAQMPGALAAQTAAMNAIRAKLRDPDGNYAKLHEEETEVKKELQRAGVQLAAAEKALHEINKAQKKHHDEQTDCVKRRAAVKKIADERAAWEAEGAACVKSVSEIQEGLRLHRSGVRAGASGVSIEEERDGVEKRLVRTKGEMRRLKERMEELEASVVNLRKKVKDDLKQSQSLQSSVEEAQKKLAHATQQYRPYEEAELRQQQLEKEHQAAQQQLHQIQAAVQDRLDPTLPLHFQHQPIPNMPDIDRAIFGRLGQLVTPKEAKYSLALSVGAQSHLMKVVIRDDGIAQALVDHGRLQNRIAFMPLNQVQPQRIDPRRVEEALSVAKEHRGFAILAKDLVLHDAAYTNVAAAIFGGFLICSDLRLARALVNNPKVAVKAVTIDGDVVDPNGTMSGGSVDDKLDLLNRIHQQAVVLEPLTKHKLTMQQLDRERLEIATRVGKGGSIRQLMEVAEEEVVRLQGHLKSMVGDSGDRLEREERELKKVQADIPLLVREEEMLQQRRAEIDKQSSQDATSIEKQLEQQLKEVQQRGDAVKLKLSKGATEFDRMEADVEQREADLQTRRAELEREATTMQQGRDSAVTCKEQLEQRIQAILQERRANDERRVALEREEQEAEAQLRTLHDRQDGEERRAKELESAIKGVVKSIVDREKHLHDMSRRTPWIQQEQSSFGVEGGPYAFLDHDATASKLKEIDEAESLCDKMSRKVNKKSTIMYDAIKRDYEELLDKRETLNEDREAILEAIHQVEARKWSALDRMVQTVSQIFSTLFSACLPGAAAKLVEERNDNGHICGLQVRVLFNGKEKESLTELSGGQRSLLALCLILAILRLKPAPIYILDEVDAALDPSHTQNIGRMLQQHFSNSQFLLVSLKDGMFNHANVLYEVRNTQGYSEITRKEAHRR